MGLPLTDAALLVDLLRKEQHRTVLCLGRPNILWNVGQLRDILKRLGVPVPHEFRALANTTVLDFRQYFEALGFSDCLVMDVSDYEGADVVHDLNQPLEDSRWHAMADVVLDGGTLEHVFDVPRALTTIHELLRVGGFAVHMSPCNGYVDHGFWQMSPTLFYDYYSFNDYEIHSANLIDRLGGDRVCSYRTDIYRSAHPLESVRTYRRTTLLFVSRKTAASTAGRSPIQSYYRQVHTGQQQTYRNLHPYDVDLRPNVLKRTLKTWLPANVKKSLQSQVGRLRDASSRVAQALGHNSEDQSGE